MNSENLYWDFSIIKLLHSEKIYVIYICKSGLPTWCSDKESACCVGNFRKLRIPCLGQGRSLWRRKQQTIQYSFLEMDRRALSGALQSINSQRVWHDWAHTHVNLLFTAYIYNVYITLFLNISHTPQMSVANIKFKKFGDFPSLT